MNNNDNINNNNNKNNNKKNDIKNDIDDELYFEPNLFINNDYIIENIKFNILNNNNNIIEQDIYCSNAASTDFDLTGQIIWPISIYLSYFIHTNSNLFINKNIIELGSGCGLAGLTSSLYGQNIIITDGNDIVLDLLKNNIDLQLEEYINNNNVLLTCDKLIWGNYQSYINLYNKYNNILNNCDIILGCDIVCWDEYIIPLIETLKVLFLQSLLNNNIPIMYLGYVNRANNTKNNFFNSLNNYGFLYNKISSNTFVPEPLPDNLYSTRELELYEIKFDLNKFQNEYNNIELNNETLKNYFTTIDDNNNKLEF